MIENIIHKQSTVYKENFLKEGPCPKGVFWNNSKSQYLRFERLFSQLPKLPEAFTIHDVGCGICDLHSFLLSKNIKHVYSGTEIVQEMVDYSLKKYSDIQIYNRDLLNAPVNEKHDVVVLSGTLNLFSDVSPEHWREYSLLLIKKMYEMSNIGISFNFLTTYNTFTNPDLCYFDPLEMFDFCMKNLSRFVILDHAYPLYEATLTVFKKEYIKTMHSEIEYEKYLQ